MRALYDENLYNQGKYEAPSEETSSSTSSQETSQSEPQTKTYRKTYKPNPEQYNYYNTMDFDEHLQEEFIKWIDKFSYEYIRIVFDYYRKLNMDDNGILEKIYDDFNNIVGYEKELSKKEKNSYRNSCCL